MRIILIICMLFIATAIQAQHKGVERPRLVVGIVVDQMRWDYLYRYYENYSENGFKRLMKEGFNCEQTMIHYIPAFTAPGHACIYTGSVPSINGIAGNDWIDNATGRFGYCVEDTAVAPVGGSRVAGMMSPRNLFTSTITDELRLATNFNSRCYGISIKDRGAILPAGHLANGAYWYDDSTGSLVSSSYYKEARPEWLKAFNGRHLPDSLLRKEWTTMKPFDLYRQSLPDSNRYEGLIPGEKAPVFGHLSNTPLNYFNLRRIPAGNTYSLAAAKACITGAALGARGYTDFLSISLSSTDYIGHQYGPNSIEVEDTYYKLDLELAAFMQFLDSKVGKGNYLLFMTADHGGAHSAPYMEDINLPGGNMMEAKLRTDIKAFADAEMGAFGGARIIRGVNNDQVYLDEQMIRGKGQGVEEAKRKIREWLEQRREIAYVIDMKNIANEPVPEPIKTMAINGYSRFRSGSLLMIFNAGWYGGYQLKGTTHGTWHPYDTHIPLIWYGWKINKGSMNRTVFMEDIAATIASLLHIQMPNGCVGKPITEVVR